MKTLHSYSRWSVHAYRSAARMSGTDLSALTRASPETRLEAGRALRSKVPRKSHAVWKAPSNRPDPIQLLIDSDNGRIAKLLPIRYARMSKSPFTFLRGAAAIMAFDLAQTPTTRLRVQACGDCHIMNFGGFATPERNLIFDINDFDETLPAPWEWDLKRLTTSIEVAGRSAGSRSKDCERAVRAAVQSYREHMAEYATMPALEVWYEHIDLKSLIKRMPEAEYRKQSAKAVAKARKKSIPSHVYPSLADGKKAEIKDDPPLIYHESKQRKPAYRRQAVLSLKRYREHLLPAYRVLFDRYQLRDIALKVVGIGSVGTYCEAALLTDPENAPLFLQIKEARASVLERYAGASRFATHGERVVVGQRLMQAASDIFLGWTVGLETRRHFYVRQLRDMKIRMPLDTTDSAVLAYFAEACGWALARAHARSGDAAMIAGYMGSNSTFDDAITKFAADYADQTESDHAVLKKAIKAGRLVAQDA
jgi:uncharacterized protein (DUF2252 family)